MNQNQVEKSKAGYYLFLLYTISFFFRLPERIPFLGSIRFDFIIGLTLLLLVFYSYFFVKSSEGDVKQNTTGYLLGLIIYIIVTIPLVQWPGTVLKQGFPLLLKNIVFYFFAITFIKDGFQLKRYVNLYLVLLLIIIIEPLFHYFTDGTMGYVDYSMGEEGDIEFRRLTGVTSKIGGNPNGLAGVVAITFPIIFFLYKYYKSTLVKLSLLACIPASVVTIILTGSRSGMLAFLVAIVSCFTKSWKALVGGIAIAVIVGSLVWGALDDIHKQRYLSIVDPTAQGREGAIGRVEHIKRAVIMFSKKPLFGHGVGTYHEANWKHHRKWMASHSLYTGVLVEIGLMGFLIYFIFIFGIFKNALTIKKSYGDTMEKDKFLITISNILQSVLITQLAFSVFAGGPSYYIWFLLGGLSVVALQITKNDKQLIGSPVT